MTRNPTQDEIHSRNGDIFLFTPDVPSWDLNTDAYARDEECHLDFMEDRI